MSKAFGFPKAAHLCTKTDFDLTYRTGNKLSGYLYSAYFRSGFFSFPRIGISIPKRLGDAVFRNRRKRLVREAFRHFAPSFQAPLDLVITLNSVPGNPRQEAAELDRIFAWLSGYSEA